MISVALIATLIAFPRPGQKLPFLESCYIIGSTDPSTVSVWVGGHAVPVYRTGAWATCVSVSPGTNTIAVCETNVTFVVAAPPKSSSGTANSASAKVWAKLACAADGPQAHPSALTDSPSNVTIVLDPGHGGKDDGAISPHHLPEKDANLRVAKAVRAALQKRGYNVVMTREADVAVPLLDRPELAHRVGAAAFVSIHHNAPPLDRNPNELRYTAAYAWNDIGRALARSINDSTAAAFPDSELKNNGVISANYAVTRNPEIPSCLLEIDFITSPAGEEASWSPARRARMAEAIAAGIDRWAFETPPLEHTCTKETP